jgi:2-methylcitrate dehydratase PrpD
MAEAMIQGTLDKTSFDAGNLRDHRYNELADKVHAVVDPLATDRSQLGGHVEIELRDGRKVAFTVEHMRGMPQNPMTADDIVRKFQSNVGNLMPDGQIDRIIGIIMSLERMNDIAPLMAELRR